MKNALTKYFNLNFSLLYKGIEISKIFIKSDTASCEKTIVSFKTAIAISEIAITISKKTNAILGIANENIEILKCNLRNCIYKTQKNKYIFGNCICFFGNCNIILAKL